MLTLSSYTQIYKNSNHEIWLNFLHNTCLIDPKDKSALSDYGMINKDENDNNNFIKINQMITSQKNHKYHFTLIPTLSCNLMCKYCYEATMDRKSYFWDEATIINVIKTIHNIRTRYNLNSFDINILGGEIFQPQFEKSLSCLFEKLIKEDIGRVIHIISNGLNLNIMRSFIELYSNSISSFQFTIDGTKELHDKRRTSIDGRSSFDEIINSLNWLTNFAMVQLRIHVDHENIDTLSALISYLLPLKKQYGKKLIMYVYPITIRSDLSKDEILLARKREISYLKKVLVTFSNYQENNNFEQIYLDFPGALGIYNLLNHKHFKLRNTYCGANKYQYVFGKNGCIYKCWWCLENQKHVIGDLNSGIDFKCDNFWQSRTILEISKCRGCIYALLCGGGCAYKSYLAYDDIYQPFCPDFEEIIKLLIGYKFGDIENVRRIA